MEFESKKIETTLSKNERKKEILEKIRRAGSEEYETEWDDQGRIGQQKKKSKIKSGRTSRAGGASFELKVRKDLESKRWTVDKWSNNVDLDLQKVVPAKRKFNPFSKVMTIGTGFPDFIAFQMINPETGRFNVVGVEVKSNGLLSREEKKKCQFLVDRDIFSEVWVAKKIKRGRRVFVEYENALSIIGRMRK